VPGITLKDIPSPLYHRLVELAHSHHRSLTKEIIVALEQYVQQPREDKTAVLQRIRSIRDRYSASISEADVESWKDTDRP
jgi:hypothetical protein